MPITCPLRARLLRNLCETYYVHVIGPLRAYYVTHVTRYLKAPRNGLYYVHVIELVRRPLPVGALVMARGAGGAWRLYSVREPYDELGAREVQLAELEVGYFEIGSEQSVAHVAANDHAMTRVPATLPADGLYEVGGSLYSVAERPGRKGAVRQTIQLEWRLACRMADAAEADRGDLSGSVSEWPSASSGGSGRSAWTGVGRSLRSPLVFAAAADSPRSGATAAEPDTPYRPAPGERRVDSPPSVADARADDERPAAGGEGDALDRLTAEVGKDGHDHWVL